MNIRELLIPFLLALTSVLALNYYFGNMVDQGKGDQTIAGQRFVAPKKPEVLTHKPLNLEVDFLDVKPHRKTQITTIDTDLARYEFSNNGASLTKLEIKRVWAGKQEGFTTLFPPQRLEREKATFLVALDEKTPYYYDLVDFQEQQDRYLLSYKVSVGAGTLTKTFIIFKKEYRINLELAWSLVGDAQSVQPRIFFAAPILPGLHDTWYSRDVISGIIADYRHKITTIPMTERMLDSYYWFNPSLFGTQDRYFVHALVQDLHNFTQRAYFKPVGTQEMYSILEGPRITQNAAWTLSFYFGPKEDDAMSAVDSRLEQTLNYGWFSIISKPLSKFLLETLNFLHNYVHNYGWALIVLTILLKLCMVPFTYRAEESMKKAMKKRGEFQKKLEHIQTKYKDDPESLAQARADLVRQQGLSDFGGCLPNLLQLPIFWALSIILANAIELYKAPFLWIPDLSAPDPYYILPTIMALSIMLHTTGDSKQRMSFIFIGIVIGALFTTLAAGLSLYIAVSTFLGILQTFIVRKMRL